ncbi:tRNA (5-methylaminomethyl-2-thiouridine)(34)-methyltransferase MnmD [Algirhabdus cladophorae]|uniref:tRNA (5-methylaminomethyl-2-thiouridine)(34)-methyltransferase MnmD n=1 Tax=Algirhabdus cladophorae TaxID=3377108 RepID=UPI003B848C95
MEHHQSPKLIWRDNALPIAENFDDPYYSLENGAAETVHVFVEGNGLPARFCEGFHIAELGFGTALNLCVARAAWAASGTKGPLRFTSFEAFPMEPDDMARALAAFADLAPWADPVIEALRAGQTRLETPELHFEVILGDARNTLPRWPDRADAWFLDGFSPAKNPQLWEADLMQDVFNHTADKGTAATYTAAGFVRRNLQDAGFEVTRVKGFGRKRHMTQAVRP